MKAADTNEYVEVTNEPDFEQWAESALRARTAPVSSFANLGPETRQTLRAELMEAAESYTSKLNYWAEQAGIPCPAIVTPGRAKPLLMTGHQPVVFHSGLVFKYEQVNRLSCQLESPAVAVTLDTDEGDGGVFDAPESNDAKTAGPWTVARRVSARLATSSNLFYSSRVRNRHEVRQVFDEAARQLAGCDHPEAVDLVRQVGRWYSDLEGTPIAAAHAVTRRACGIATRLFELPMSQLYRLPSVRTAVAGWIAQSDTLVPLYNQTLNEFRAERGIKNPANPFPNLVTTQGQVELPFWIMDLENDRRAPLQARSTKDGIELCDQGTLIGKVAFDDPALPNGELIVPRGALVSLFFRALMCDFFVHGLGGRTYDRFTNELIRAALQVEPPAFAVASASRYLFSEERLRVRQLEEWSEMERDLIHHPEQYLDRNVYSADTVTWLRERIAQKEGFVQRLRHQKQHGLSAADEGKQLARLQQEVKARVVDELSGKLTDLHELSDDARQAIMHRGYPWFFFSPSSPHASAPC